MVVCQISSKMENRAKDQVMLTASLIAMIKVHIHFYFTGTMACHSETCYFGVFHVTDD